MKNKTKKDEKNVIRPMGQVPDEAEYRRPSRETGRTCSTSNWCYGCHHRYCHGEKGKWPLVQGCMFLV